MPPTSDNGSSTRRLSLAALPDRDNPLAWKRKTAEGKAGARQLLVDLTDEEVARYMGVAQDQVRLEERLAAIKMVCAASGAALLSVCLWHGLWDGFHRPEIAGLLLGLMMVYWPWRVFKCRQLWQSHLHATRVELARRQIEAARQSLST